MQKPYQLILDIWEGNDTLDPVTCKENGVIGMIVRLNSMNGGHHMDDDFERNWAWASVFPVQTIYFVYNPWVDGRTNFNWLMAHLPPNFGKRRIMIDIEVTYDGYSPVTYKSQVDNFLLLLSLFGYRCAIYTGLWFLNRLASWPVDEEYWWAAYPSILDCTTDWDVYRKRLDVLNMSAFSAPCPGRARIWQCSGDKVDNLPGFGGHAVDVNAMTGTLEEVAKWFGCDLNNDEGSSTMTNPIGLFTRKAGWTANNPNFNFVAGAAQVKNTADPNPEIKPIEQEAIAGKIPMFLWWDHLPFLYSEQQWGEANWPNESNDYPFQNLKTIMANRTYNAVVISVNTYKMRNGEPEDIGFLAFSARSIMDRAQAWLRANRPMVPLILACSDAFMTLHAPNMKNWAHNFGNMAVELTAIKDAYPLTGAKPKYLGNNTECQWWRYYEMTDQALLLFRGENGYPPTIEGMAQWLNIDPKVPPPPPKPPEDPDATEFDKLKLRVEANETAIAAILTALKKPILA